MRRLILRLIVVGPMLTLPAYANAIDHLSSSRPVSKPASGA
jgi:hypothetical protein